MKQFTYFTLFGGAGIGTSRLKEIGGISLGSIELSAEQRELWVLNNVDAPSYPPQSVVEASLPNHIDVLQASPPCIYSSPARKSGTVSRDNIEQEDYLLETTLVHFNRARPKLFILENVPLYFNLRRMERLEYVAALTGYHFKLCHYKGAAFGLPICRDRGFAVFSECPLADRDLSLQLAKLGWPSLLRDHLEPETRGLTKWQTAALEKEKPQTRMILMPRVGSWAGKNICYEKGDNLPAITASLGDDGHNGNGRRRMWTVYDQALEQAHNVKISGFAALMGVPESFIFTVNYRRDMRAIGNGIIPAIINDLVQRSNFNKHKNEVNDVTI
jgi:site-specific DNA-cytosine methylase